MMKQMPELVDKAVAFDRLKAQVTAELSNEGLLGKRANFRGSKRFEKKVDRKEAEKPEIPPKPKISEENVLELINTVLKPRSKADRPETSKKSESAKPEVPKKPVKVQIPSKSAPKRRRSSSISEQPEDKRKKVDFDEEEFEVLDEKNFETKTATENEPPKREEDLEYVVLDSQTSTVKIPRIGTFYFRVCRSSDQF